MKFEFWETPEDMKRHYKLEIDYQDLCVMRLDDFDRALIRDCEGADRTIADRLLALELIARRIEEGLT